VSAGISLRTATEDDHELLVALYGSIREEELALTGWDEPQREAFIRSQFAAQRDHYRSRRPAGREEIILLDGEAIGRLYSDLSGETEHLLDICLFPGHRERGFGSEVLRKVLQGAAAKGRRVTVYVESFNPALRFFERHGFSKAGETGIHFLMEWRPGRNE
jgi:ribosomal protein S18 acetylase RimI-like enzyme